MGAARLFLLTVLASGSAALVVIDPWHYGEVGRVKNVQGAFVYRPPKGTKITLKQNDPVYANDLVEFTLRGAGDLEITQKNGRVVHVTSRSLVKFEPSDQNRNDFRVAASTGRPDSKGTSSVYPGDQPVPACLAMVWPGNGQRSMEVAVTALTTGATRTTVLEADEIGCYSSQEFRNFLREQRGKGCTRFSWRPVVRRSLELVCDISTFGNLPEPTHADDSEEGGTFTVLDEAADSALQRELELADGMESEFDRLLARIAVLGKARQYMLEAVEVARLLDYAPDPEIQKFADELTESGYAFDPAIARHYQSVKAGLMAEISAGEFTRGSEDMRYRTPTDAWEAAKSKGDEEPIAKVTLRAYTIGKYPVTVGEFKKYCAATGIDFHQRYEVVHPKWIFRDDHPMVYVTWEEARSYCKWMGGDLPTEAQWERAARGTDGRTYPWDGDFSGSNLWYRPRVTNYTSSSVGTFTAPVGSFPSGASPDGCLDMAGNVLQWCRDWYRPGYVGQPTANPVGPEGGTERVLRGGSWVYSNPFLFRCANRFHLTPNESTYDIGFRVAGPPVP